MGLIESFGTAVGNAIDSSGIADKIVAKLVPWAETKADQLAQQYLPIVVEKILAMMPTLAATVAKVAVEEAFKQIPQLPNVVLPEVSQIAGQVASNVAPELQHIPGLSDLVPDLTGLINSWTHPGGQQ